MKNLTTEAFGQTVGLDIRIATQDVLVVMALFALMVILCVAFATVMTYGPRGACCVPQQYGYEGHASFHCTKVQKAKAKARKAARKAAAK
jgi:hypothetical protein